MTVVITFFSSTQAGLGQLSIVDFSVVTPYIPDSPPKEKSSNKHWRVMCCLQQLFKYGSIATSDNVFQEFQVIRVPLNSIFVYFLMKKLFKTLNEASLNNF